MKYIQYILLFFVVFTIYLYTLHPSVSPYRDSGDLIVAASTFGIAHPPGYPLYVIIGKAFDVLIPFGNTAYKINVMSAFFGAGALFCVALILGYIMPINACPPNGRGQLQSKKQGVVADLSANFWLLASGLFLAFSPAFWRLSQVSEMYSMNAFFAALIFVFAAVLYRTPLQTDSAVPPTKLLYIISFISGFASANHQTIIFIFPGLLWLLYKEGSYKVSDYIAGALYFILGLSVYVFMPLRALTQPISDWGEPDTIKGFFRIITRSDYGGMRLHPEQSKFEWTAGLLLNHIYIYVKALIAQFSWPGAMLGVTGIFLYRKNRFFQALLIALLVSGPGFIMLSNLPPHEETTLPILEPHLVLPNLIFVLFIAACAFRLIARPAGKVLIAVFVLLVFVKHLSLCNYRTHFFAYDYGRNFMKTVDKNGFIYNPDDPTAFIATYLQACEAKRPDIKLIAYFRTRWGYELMKKRYPEILPEREIQSGRELETVILDHNRTAYSIYSEFLKKFPPGYPAYPVGLIYKLSSFGEFAPYSQVFEFYSMRKNYLVNSSYDFFTNRIISYYASARTNLGLAYANNKMFDLARSQYYMALGMEPDLKIAHNNLGSLEYLMGDYTAARMWFQKVLARNPANESALFNLGLTHKAMQETLVADKYFRQLWNKNRSAVAGNELGLIYLNSGDFNRAIEYFRETIKSNPDYMLAYFNLGLSFQRAGNFSQSRRYYTEYLNRVSDPAEKQEVEAIINALP